MTGLVLKLGPRERIMINGVVMENGDRRTRLNVITRDAHVLRLRDAIHPDQARTPVTRVCYVAQMILAGEASEAAGLPQLLSGITQLRFAFLDTESQGHLLSAEEAARERRFYPALKSLRALIPRELALLERDRKIAEPT